MELTEAIGYWIAQVIGAIIGALILYGIVSSAPGYSTSHRGLGTDGWGHGVSMVGIGAGGAFATEVVLTFTFVLVVLIATSKIADWLFIVAPLVGGLLAGLAYRYLVPEGGHEMPPATTEAPLSGAV